jgi:hypothetical protein
MGETGKDIINPFPHSSETREKIARAKNNGSTASSQPDLK